MTEQAQNLKKSKIPVLREVKYCLHQKRQRVWSGKAQLHSEIELVSLDEQLRHSEFERDKLTRAFEALNNELARCKNDNEQLAAKVATCETSVNGTAPISSEQEQEEDLLIAQLVNRVITSQQRFLLTEGGTTSPLYRGTDCAEGTCTVPCCAACTHGDTDTAHRHTQAAPDTTVQQDGIATSLTGSKAARDSELAANAVLQKELDSLRVKLLSEQERNVKQEGMLKMYQDRYYQCLEHCGLLQAQVHRHTSLLRKVEVAMELKEKSLALLRGNVATLDQNMTELSAHRETWNRQLSSLTLRVEDLTKERNELLVLEEASRSNCEQLLTDCAHSLASWSIQRALVLELGEQVDKLKAHLGSKVAEASDSKKKLAQYHNIFKRSQQEYQETLEFSDAERTSLLQSIKELESQVQSLCQQLQLKEAFIATLKTTEVNARELRMSLQLSQAKISKYEELEVSVRGAYQLFRGLLASIGGGDKMSRHPENSNEIESDCLGRHIMSVGIDLQRRLQHASLQSAGAAMGSHGNHGELCHEEDLLKENLYLNERITELTHELEQETGRSKSLQEYTEEYQSSATCKIAVLKENVAKADLEIAELDKLIDHMREVMRGELDLIKRSPQLLSLLRELDGNEAPPSY